MDIFDVPRDEQELKSAFRVSRTNYVQYAPTRDVTTASFPNGLISFKWTMGGQQWWEPSKTYIRIRAKLTRGDGAPLTMSDGVAPQYNMAPCLFNKLEMKAGGATLGTSITEFLPQIDTLKQRSEKSKAWRESMGYASSWLQTSFIERQRQVAADGGQYPVVATITDRVGLGIDALTTVQYTVVDAFSGTAVFALGVVVDVATIWVVGDILMKANGDRYTVTGVVSPATLNLRRLNVDVVAAAAAVANFSRERSRPFVPGTYSDAGRSRGVGGFELIWKPPLSIFDLDHALPSGDYELTLNPQNNALYQASAYESLTGKNPGVGAGDVKFEVTDMYMYVAIAEGVSGDELSYILDLEEVQCQSDSLANGPNRQQKNFDVSPSTYALALAFQSNDTLSNTIHPATKYKIAGSPLDPYGEEARLTQFFINYATINKPQPDADPIINNANPVLVDQSIQRYIETQMNNGLYYNAGGGESIQEWQDSGMYYYFNWPKDGNDVSTRVQVTATFFNGGGLTSPALILLFYKFKVLTRITVMNGRITSIRSEQR